ncbi:hypothetical protein V7R84_11435 [Arachnia propionica]|uniref:hypothetical protein n=1 Tax=Arachnia propionica TaxID=1750 RepID=UPI0030CB4012
MVRAATWPRPIPKGHSWRTLVGEGWPAHVRVLHPASRWIDGVEHPVRWREIAPEGVSIATAGWFEVSGIRLHEGTAGPGWDHEPDIGPSPLILPVLLRQILTGCSEGRLWMGEWDGWGSRRRPAVSRSLTVPGRRYHMTATSPRELLTSLDPDRLPDVVWDEAGTFIILADIDLPSTIVGCREGIAEGLLRNPNLEAVRVDGGAPIVT